jgi:hypothetical protein
LLNTERAVDPVDAELLEVGMSGISGWRWFDQLGAARERSGHRLRVTELAAVPRR